MDESQRSAQHAAVFGALAHPVRHELFHLLCEGPRSPGELATLLGITRPNASQHLAILRRGGLAHRVRSDGRVVWQVIDVRLGQACALIDDVLSRELKSRLYALERKSSDVPRQ
jgi:DNA-binding transcriptional ArsR family regulator